METNGLCKSTLRLLDTKTRVYERDNFFLHLLVTHVSRKSSGFKDY